MGSRIGDPIEDPPDSLEVEAVPQLTVFGGATVLTNQLGRVIGTSVFVAPTCSNESEFSNICIRVPWHVESRFVGSDDHFRLGMAPASTAAVVESSLSGPPITSTGML